MDRWIPTRGALARLFPGLVLFGAGEALVVASELGNSPWTVFAEGVAQQTGLTIGTASVAVSGLVLLAWVPLRQCPGFGTVANAIVIGLVIDAVLALMGPVEGTAGRVSALVAGIGLVALGSGFYLGAILGPGPRDGLMTGIHRITGWPVGTVRNGLEFTVALAGFALGGTLGLGTLTFALAIGPAVALSLRTLSPVPATHL
jgi:uncharacterized membrane protein YczE